MVAFQVFDTSRDGGRVAMLDHRGRLYVARTLAAAPLTDEPLLGESVALGRCLLSSALSTQVFPLEFELLDCSQLAALERVHPLR